MPRSSSRYTEPPDCLGGAGAISLLTASQVLLGYPQFVWISIIGECLYLLLCVVFGRRVSGLVVDYLIAKAIGFLLAATQLLPTIDALSNSTRAALDGAGRLQHTANGSLHPLNFLLLACPYAFASRGYFSSVIPESVSSIYVWPRIANDGWGPNMQEYGFYAGLMPVILVLALLARPSDQPHAVDAHPEGSGFRRPADHCRSCAIPGPVLASAPGSVSGSAHQPLPLPIAPRGSDQFRAGHRRVVRAGAVGVVGEWPAVEVPRGRVARGGYSGREFGCCRPEGWLHPSSEWGARFPPARVGQSSRSIPYSQCWPSRRSPLQHAGHAGPFFCSPLCMSPTCRSTTSRFFGESSPAPRPSTSSARSTTFRPACTVGGSGSRGRKFKSARMLTPYAACGRETRTSDCGLAPRWTTAVRSACAAGVGWWCPTWFIADARPISGALPEVRLVPKAPPQPQPPPRLGDH